MTDLEPFWLSLWVAALATALIVTVGLPAAWALARLRFRGKSLVAGILVLPLVLPPTVLGFYLLQVLGRRAWLGHWLEHSLGITIVFHWSGAVVASAVAAFPLFLLPARGAFEAVDPALEDVARLLGRSELSVFFAVTLPLAWRGLAAGIVLAFARALGDFGATLMVAGNIPDLTQTAALAIYDAVQINDMARAGRLTLLISLVAIVALVIVQRSVPRAERCGERPDRRCPGCLRDPRGPSCAAARCSSPARPRDRRRFRTIRGRQDDLTPVDRGTDHPSRGSCPPRGRSPFRRCESGQSTFTPPPDRHDLPGRLPVPASERSGKHPVRAQGLET